MWGGTKTSDVEAGRRDLGYFVACELISKQYDRNFKRNLEQNIFHLQSFIFFWLQVGVEYSYILKPKHRARHIVLLCNEYVTEIQILRAKRRTEMKVDLKITKSLTSKQFYVVINDEFYIKVKKKLFYQLAEYLKIDLGEEK